MTAAKSTRRRAVDVMASSRWPLVPSEAADIIDALEAEGITLITTAGHKRTLDAARAARLDAHHAEQRRRDSERWARDAHLEERRLARRLVDVVAWATARDGDPVKAEADLVRLNHTIDDLDRRALLERDLVLNGTDLRRTLLDHLEASSASDNLTRDLLGYIVDEAIAELTEEPAP